MSKPNLTLADFKKKHVWVPIAVIIFSVTAGAFIGAQGTIFSFSLYVDLSANCADDDTECFSIAHRSAMFILVGSFIVGMWMTVMGLVVCDYLMTRLKEVKA